MIRLLCIGLWAACIASGAGYAGLWWQMREKPAAASETGEHSGHGALQQVKTRSVSVPMIAEGEVQGYIVAQFTFMADGEALKASAVPPEPFLLDEAFRAIYQSPVTDFRHIEKFDLAALTRILVERMRERLGAPIVRDVLVQEFTYVSKADIRK